MSFDITGKLHKTFETEQKTQTFQAREFVLEINESNYINYIKFQLTQDRCELIDHFSEGDQVKVYFDLRGREWNGKYFTNLNAWKIENAKEGEDTFPESSPPDHMDFSDSDTFPDSSDEPQYQKSVDEDLPF